MSYLSELPKVPQAASGKARLESKSCDFRPELSPPSHTCNLRDRIYFSLLYFSI